MKTKIKVCGMREATNMRQVLDLKPDYMGFIFYPQSARYFPETDLSLIENTNHTRNTAVFVNADKEHIDAVLSSGKFQALQLHGNESADFCRSLKHPGVELIKAFGVDESFDFSVLGDYMDVVDYFLFDTKTKGYGGSGEAFSWECLKGYSFQKPYFLSGGIGPDNFIAAYSFEDERLYAVDINSRFESSPGVKEINLLDEVFKISKYE